MLAITHHILLQSKKHSPYSTVGTVAPCTPARGRRVWTGPWAGSGLQHPAAVARAWLAAAALQLVRAVLLRWPPQALLPCACCLKRVQERQRGSREEGGGGCAVHRRSRPRRAKSQPAAGSSGLCSSLSVLICCTIGMLSRCTPGGGRLYVQGPCTGFPPARRRPGG